MPLKQPKTECQLVRSTNSWVAPRVDLAHVSEAGGTVPVWREGSEGQCSSLTRDNGKSPLTELAGWSRVLHTKRYLSPRCLLEQEKVRHNLRYYKIELWMPMSRKTEIIIIHIFWGRQSLGAWEDTFWRSDIHGIKVLTTYYLLLMYQGTRLHGSWAAEGGGHEKGEGPAAPLIERELRSHRRMCMEE